MNEVFSQCNLPPLLVLRILIKPTRLCPAHVMQSSRLVRPRDLQPAGHSAPTWWIVRISATHIIKAIVYVALNAFVIWTSRIACRIRSASDVAGCRSVTDATGPTCCGRWVVMDAGDLGCARGTRRRWDMMDRRDFGRAPRTRVSVILTSPFELVFLSCA